MPNRFMRVSHVLTMVLVSLMLTACLGEGGGLRVEPTKTFSISGTVDIVAGVVLDSDINDSFQPGVARAQSTLLANAFVRSEAIAPGIELMHIQRPVLRSQQQSQGAIPPEHAQWYAKRQTLIDIKTLRQRSDVQVVEPNYVRRLLRVPNDPRYSLQWHYPAIQLPAAWDDTIGESEQSSDPVIVAVLDTGVFLQHEDLQGRLVTGRDFVSNDNCNCAGDDPGDSDQLGQSSWHGTHVAGTIAADSNNGIGVTGVSWGAQIMPIRVLGKDGIGFSSDILQGVRYAAGLSNNSGALPTRRADVINLSLGGTSSSTFEQNTYNAVANEGVIVVAAAGNENTSQRSYPAAYNNVLAVSATEFRNQRAYYSNFGSWIDLAAPGGDLRADGNGDGQPDGVLSTFVDDRLGKTKRRSSYAFQQGTSMAAPHVAGVIALMKAVSPTLTVEDIYTMLSNNDLTDDLGVAGRDNQFGWGLINAQKSVQAARNHSNANAPIVTPDPNEPELPVIERVQLRADKTSLVFDLADSLSFVLRNDNGNATIDTFTVTKPSWLELVGSDIGSYQATVDRTDLMNGLYSGTLLFTANEGQESASTLALQVTMQVGAATLTSELSPQYVLLLDAANENVLDTVLVGSNGQYRFEDVPVGDYKVIVGSDIDVNGFICEYGETCGGYPYLGAEQILRVRNANLTGIDMTVRVVSTEATGSAVAHDESALARPQGYRRGELRSNALPLSKQR